MNVVGLDLSLTSTGVATAEHTHALRPKKLSSYARLRWLRHGVLEFLGVAKPHLVVVEGPSYGSQGSSYHQLGGLWWFITEAVDATGVPLAVAPPSNIKRMATGAGGGARAGKDFVVAAAVRRFPWFDGGNDEADALWAAALGYAYLGQPIVEVPQTHLQGMEGVEWPQGLSPLART